MPSTPKTPTSENLVETIVRITKPDGTIEELDFVANNKQIKKIMQENPKVIPTIPQGVTLDGKVVKSTIQLLKPDGTYENVEMTFPTSPTNDLSEIQKNRDFFVRFNGVDLGIATASHKAITVERYKNETQGVYEITLPYLVPLGSVAIGQAHIYNHVKEHNLVIAPLRISTAQWTNKFLVCCYLYPHSNTTFSNMDCSISIKYGDYVAR